MNDQAHTTPAGWFPDPLGRYEHRWFNGTTWTADVSLHGQRYVDPAPLDAPGAVHAVMSGRQSRTRATLALLAGLAGLATAWMPFFVVVGIVAALVAIALGVGALRRIARGAAGGRGLAISGIVLGGLALAVSPLGIVLTGPAYRELQRFADPGRSATAITRCTAAGGSFSVSGTIDNREGESRSYVIDIAVTSADGVDHVHVTLEDVAAGSTAPFTLTMPSSVTDPTCTVARVTGPYPFGLEPPG